MFVQQNCSNTSHESVEIAWEGEATSQLIK